MKKALILVQFICAVAVMLATQGLKQPIQATSPPPKPPATGTPKGNSTPGTTRPAMACKQTNKPLTAINANNGNDFTSSEYPSFWFYVPYSQEDIRQAEFLLLDAQERTTIYQTTVKLAAKPGLIKITLPNVSKNLLHEHENYRWYLMLGCQASGKGEPDVVVDGWVQRKAIAPHLPVEGVNKSQKYIFYTKNHLWYDAVDSLAELHFKYPGDTEIQADWKNLLKQIDKEWVAQEQFVGVVINR